MSAKAPKPIGSPEDANNTNGSLEKVNDGVSNEAAEVSEPVLNDENSISDAESNADPFDETDRDDLIDEAMSFLARGKHLLSVKDYSSAANILLSACCKFNRIYGDMADECGDAYFFYGCALLETCNPNDNNLFIRNNRNCLRTNDIGVKQEDEVTGADDLNASADNENIVTIDDISDFQLAREVLELARVIFNRQNDEMKLIGVYFKLGRADLLLGSFHSAITNSQKCISLQEKFPSGAERDIAETLFQLGTACYLSKQYYVAVKHFTTAGVILEKRIRHLIRMAESEDCVDLPSVQEIESEIINTKTMLQNVKDKICETEDMIRQRMSYLVTPFIKNKDIMNGCESSNGVESNESVSHHRVISYLNRKRKLLVNNRSECKKRRLETEEEKNV